MSTFCLFYENRTIPFTVINCILCRLHSILDDGGPGSHVFSFMGKVDLCDTNGRAGIY